MGLVELVPVPDQQPRDVGAMMVGAHRSHVLHACRTAIRVCDQMDGLDDLRDVSCRKTQ